MLDDNRSGLNGAVRQLFARIAPGTAAPSPRPVLWEADAGGEAGPYDRDPSVRGTAVAALRRTPQRLQAPEAAPHLPRGGIYG